MKKSLLIMALMLFSTLGFAQITKGDIELGGNVGFYKFQYPDNDYSSFTIAPRGGLFVSDLTSVGIILDYGSSKSNGFNSFFFEFGVYSRFHRMVTDNFYIFLQPSVSIGTGSSENGANPETDLNRFNISIAPGMTYFLSPKFALGMNVGSLYYSSSTNKNSGVETKSNQYGLNLNLNSVSLGFSYFIKK
ncbi:MAG: hypothetical protein ACJAS3_000793 [Roseivirga sp.]|jgi:hypothetical protein